MARDILSDEDCADCICRVCARNACNDSWNPKLEEPGDRGKSCECNCGIGDLLGVYETEDDCPDFLPDIEDEETEEVSEQGPKFTLTLPCAFGTILYHVVDDCDFPDDCYTKQKCNGCGYRSVYVETQPFDFYSLPEMMNKNGSLQAGYYLSKEEADKKVEELKGTSVQY